MKSIRLSLLVYFLLLLALGLGAVCGLFYYTTSATLQEKEASTRKLYEREFENKVTEAKADLDRLLLRQARMLAGRVRHSHTFYERLYPLGALSSYLAPHGNLMVPLWICEGTHPYLAYRLYRTRPYDMYVAARPGDMETKEDDPYHDLPDPEYFQLFRISGFTGERIVCLQTGEAMGDLEFRLPHEMKKTEPLTEYYDEVEISPGTTLRRVTLKATVPRARASFTPLWWFFKNAPFRGPGPVPSPPPKVVPKPGILDASPTYTLPAFYLQAAASTAPLQEKIDGFDTELRRHVAQLHAETQQALRDLRWRLGCIGLATFGAILVGGLVLVRLGLAPLRRLSDAVSEISERDFRLKVERGKLPAELQPIAGRLSETLDQLKKAFSREKQAAADMSHELRTPLAALLTNLDVALRKQRSSEEYREVLEECRASGQQMYRLVERLLALARLDAGAIKLKSQDVDVGTLAQQCANLVRPLADARGLSLQVHAGEPVKLQADPDKLREVLTNLLHNAIEYNKPNGAIDVRVLRENGYVRLEVSDTGIGIAPEARARIFERFYRADPSRQADTPHAGLGLSIVKSYVDLMGGAISVDSSADGTTFRIDLPGENKDKPLAA